MSARIDICNYALGILGAGSITSLDDDSDKAHTLKTFYYIAKDSVLEDANWSFAIKRFQPAETNTAPSFGWNYAFTIPAYIIRVIEVLRDWGGATVLPYFWYDYPEEFKAAHVIEGNEILANDNPLFCYGIRKMDDEGGFSPLFAEAFAAKLAYLCAEPLTASNVKMQTALALYTDALKRAKNRDSMQNTTRRMRNRTLQNVR